MCEFCDLRYDESGRYSRDKQRTTTVVDGAWTSIVRGVEPNNRLFLEGVGDDTTDRYYPKYCPECGRKLTLKVKVKKRK